MILLYCVFSWLVCPIYLILDFLQSVKSTVKIKVLSKIKFHQQLATVEGQWMLNVMCLLFLKMSIFTLELVDLGKKSIWHIKCSSLTCQLLPLTSISSFFHFCTITRCKRTQTSHISTKTLKLNKLGINFCPLFDFYEANFLISTRPLLVSHRNMGTFISSNYIKWISVTNHTL